MTRCGERDLRPGRRRTLRHAHGQTAPVHAAGIKKLHGDIPAEAEGCMRGSDGAWPKLGGESDFPGARTLLDRGPRVINLCQGASPCLPRC